ncbi:lasso peptide biosynthesis B2 protein [Domibacillus sp. PGB-M46]|uniref:lasso peptide biosynthesis B2 protein n=1 Tax=Domibacillus sp. PGB-M46 TaxID=2910255 RepID=UPI001F591646|nr:lasso peptide biosynthesis B2 protein [Domibacillus sp. PGB-M46]MCI2255185.1 lasso peptide biosynthesis B2 protein [Domibacillus sp. PGB-M46]
MKFLRKIITFYRLSISMKLLFIEAFVYLGWARCLKLKSFSKVAPSLGKQMEETDYEKNIQNKKELQNVSAALHIMSHYTFWESECLVKAIAAMKMLEKRQINSTLYLGTARDKTGELVAHAWLRSGPYYITGAEGMEKYTVVGKFAKDVTSQGKRRNQ